MKKSLAGGYLCGNKKCSDHNLGDVCNCSKYGDVKQNLPYEVISKKVKECKKAR